MASKTTKFGRQCCCDGSQGFRQGAEGETVQEEGGGGRRGEKRQVRKLPKSLTQVCAEYVYLEEELRREGNVAYVVGKDKA